MLMVNQIIPFLFRATELNVHTSRSVRSVRSPHQKGHFRGEHKMETLEKDTAQVECKQPDDNQGGILRRLRDRDLLRKRKAEAEEKAIYQWVYGVQSKRKRERQEGKSGSGRKVRPRKGEDSVPPQPSQEEASQDDSVEEGLSQGVASSQPEEQLTQDTADAEEPLTSDAAKAEDPPTSEAAKAEKPLTSDATKAGDLPTSEAAKAEDLPTSEAAKAEDLPTSEAAKAEESPASEATRAVEELPGNAIGGRGESLPLPLLPLPQSKLLVPLLPPPAPPVPEPQPEIVPVPFREEAPQTETKSSRPAEEAVIQDLGPDEKEFDPPPPARPVIEQGVSVEPGDNDTDSTRVFSIPTIVSPSQSSYLPRPSL
ncbi:hypothetical protein AAFF_G00349750 [Aldrovandia affinis]|uniref:Hemogen n=1 Tax=Aldrovandia affinis TaxID=143900 RepID=A0AAD7WPK0_9TELE|nr:hypothetical protein AAFF_G00349750 [Aldrovandia affinis]